eukprot:m.416579 g.416579  ORF g.416579 m.416579 type:complete len:402 (+) comp20182_c4_seq21:22283-23488(+)
MPCARLARLAAEPASLRKRPARQLPTWTASLAARAELVITRPLHALPCLTLSAPRARRVARPSLKNALARKWTTRFAPSAPPRVDHTSTCLPTAPAALTASVRCARCARSARLKRRRAPTLPTPSALCAARVAPESTRSRRAPATPTRFAGAALPTATSAPPAATRACCAVAARSCSRACASMRAPVVTLRTLMVFANRAKQAAERATDPLPATARLVPTRWHFSPAARAVMCARRLPTTSTRLLRLQTMFADRAMRLVTVALAPVPTSAWRARGARCCLRRLASTPHARAAPFLTTREALARSVAQTAAAARHLIPAPSAQTNATSLTVSVSPRALLATTAWATKQRLASVSFDFSAFESVCCFLVFLFCCSNVGPGFLIYFVQGIVCVCVFVWVLRFGF